MGVHPHDAVHPRQRLHTYTPPGGVQPGPVCQVLRQVLHADNAVLHRTPSMRGGRYRHQGVVVQLKQSKARKPTGKVRNGEREGRMNEWCTRRKGWRRSLLLPLQVKLFKTQSGGVARIPPIGTFLGQTGGLCFFLPSYTKRASQAASSARHHSWFHSWNNKLLNAPCLP